MRRFADSVHFCDFMKMILWDRRLRGINREIGFGFVSCSCRACVRAGEAKLRGRARRCASQRWCFERQDVRLRRGILPWDFELLFPWVLRENLPLGCYIHGFFGENLNSIVILMGFNKTIADFACLRCYFRGF